MALSLSKVTKPWGQCDSSSQPSLLRFAVLAACCALDVCRQGLYTHCGAMIAHVSDWSKVNGAITAGSKLALC